METINTNTESLIEEASWNRERSIFELRNFVLRHEAALDVEDFDLA